jgi:hypothetical protein
MLGGFDLWLPFDMGSVALLSAEPARIVLRSDREPARRTGAFFYDVAEEIRGRD